MLGLEVLASEWLVRSGARFVWMVWDQEGDLKYPNE